MSSFNFKRGGTFSGTVTYTPPTGGLANLLGTTITSIPKETLDMIENVAKQCADGMQNGNGALDEKALMSSMAGLFGGLMKK
jgi:hypothetical protein